MIAVLLACTLKAIFSATLSTPVQPPSHSQGPDEAGESKRSSDAATQRDQMPVG